jgi:hypothetical protein
MIASPAKPSSTVCLRLSLKDAGLTIRLTGLLLGTFYRDHGMTFGPVQSTINLSWQHGPHVLMPCRSYVQSFTLFVPAMRDKRTRERANTVLQPTAESRGG